MNGKDLLMGLGNISPRYYDEGENDSLREGKTHGIARRPLLVAAILALTLLLVGCAVAYSLRLRDIAFGEKEQGYYDGSAQTVTMLSIQGVQGTPGYQATKEWYDWLKAYDTDMAIYHSEEAFSEDFGEEYWDYNLYSREMKDKLDEICQKYGLALLGKCYTDPDVATACAALGITGVFRPGVQPETDWDPINYYANGAFRLEGHVTLPGQSDRIVTFRCHRTSAFSDPYESVSTGGDCREWTYTTSYGVEVLMVLDYGTPRGNALLYAEQGDYVYLLTISEFEDAPLPDRAGMEAYAECFDFSVAPQPVAQEDMTAAEERQEEAEQNSQTEYYYAGFRAAQDGTNRRYPPKGYNESIPAYLSYVKEYDDGKRTHYALYDIDDDGEMETFLGTADGVLIEMLKMEDGVVAIQVCDYACQGNVLEGYFTYGFYTDNDDYSTPTHRDGSGHSYWNTDGTMRDWLLYDAETDSWREGNRYWDYATDITREQAQEIIASYPRIEMEMLPLSRYSGE